MTQSRPPLRRIILVKTLCRMREAAGLSLEEVADRLESFSRAKLSRIEQARSAVSGDDTYALCQVYGADEATTGTLVQLARKAKQRGWWHLYKEVLGRAVDAFELEEDAVEIHEFGVDVLPGLLQTEDYARAVIRHADPTAADEIIDQRVAARIQRQKRFIERQIRLWAIVDQAALARPIGGRSAMITQLEYLSEVAQDVPHASIQILPTNISGHAALGAPYFLLTLADGSKYPYLDTLTGGAYLDDPDEVAVYETAWSRLAAMAVDFEKSAMMVRDAIQEHRSQ
ncbi:helix-turn-helix protein [Tamaricihabitans halophyticus]|uniref:Helix-turn-helix protein n=1 Tax=Tamaricihabitans halophyticus TaxID=1262583 RepID=A0A4R2QUF7_9PSEU|nr:helix-turn-helix transcriptional regulator [Tamaricihabitans halophyticus]TCP53600.1 helix-turn-helix protein [Tamaricihabitans halophyticus]